LFVFNVHGFNGKGKGMVIPALSHEDVCGWRYNPPFLFSSIVRGEWSASSPGNSARYPLFERLSGPQSRSGRYRGKNFAPESKTGT
jgi:hypothetical protein